MQYRHMMRSIAMISLTVSSIASEATAQKHAAPQPDRRVVYRHTPQTTLKLHLFVPPDWKPADRRSAIVFFFGGGWVGGRPSQFYHQARALADRGMVAACAEYRVRSRDKTTPFECVSDGQAAIVFVRAHASELGVDPKRIAASGGSAGGHVAVCTAAIPPLDKTPGETAVSNVPNLVIAFNPVVDTGPKGNGYNKLKERYRELSPVDHITEGLPPMLIFHGTADKTVPFENVDRFAKKMKAAGNECRLVPFDGMGHGFFNFGRHGNDPYRKTMAEAVAFLTQHGFLPAP